MAEQIKGQHRIRELISRNSATLLQLINQILDLRKVESGKLKLNLVQGDLVRYLQYILASHESLADQKDIQLHFISREPELLMDFDQEKLMHILSNLLSNAIKFTPPGGHIYVDVKRTGKTTEPEIAEIRVTDTGIGVPAADQPFIFDRFYQVGRPPGKEKQLGAEAGTGIGLAFVKELVTLLGGEISLESQPEKGSTFSISLPVSRSAPIANITEQEVKESLRPNLAEANSQWVSAPTDNQAPTDNGQQLSLLIIEDNPDVQEYLTSLLDARYQLLLASDGQEGIDLALEHIPDLIISDVMMPRKDGYEVCDHLKQTEQTSHIPIVLLTAKASVASRIKGLKKGADAYLAKPFNQEELMVRLENLAELRKSLQQRYQSMDLNTMAPTKDPVIRQEDAFIMKLRKTVEKNMSDPEFGPKDLCKAIGMSRTMLHLKLKALTKRSTSNFIRTLRLYKAKELLLTSDFNVNETAYEVGFKDPDYFSRKFREEFGITPSNFGKI